MREIIFRGKRRDNDEWVCGDLFSLFERPCIKFGKTDKELVEVRSETVGQFTGLLDKNGNKIFEGDILSGCPCWWDEKDILGIVEYGNGTFDSGCYVYTGFYYRCIYTNDIDGTNLYQEFIDESHIEVIGNIYDNAEMLKAGIV